MVVMNVGNRSSCNTMVVIARMVPKGGNSKAGNSNGGNDKGGHANGGI